MVSNSSSFSGSYSCSSFMVMPVGFDITRVINCAFLLLFFVVVVCVVAAAPIFFADSFSLSSSGAAVAEISSPRTSSITFSLLKHIASKLSSCSRIEDNASVNASNRKMSAFNFSLILLPSANSSAWTLCNIFSMHGAASLSKAIVSLSNTTPSSCIAHSKTSSSNGKCKTRSSLMVVVAFFNALADCWSFVAPSFSWISFSWITFSIIFASADFTKSSLFCICAFSTSFKYFRRNLMKRFTSKLSAFKNKAVSAVTMNFMCSKLTIKHLGRMNIFAGVNVGRNGSK